MNLKPIHYLLAVLLVAGLIVAWWLISPLFINQTVEEAFPFSEGASIPAEMEQSEVEDIMAGMAKLNSEMTEDAPDNMSTATALKTGQLRDADSFHKGSGELTIYTIDQENILRVEDLNVTNGPDLHVILSAHPNPSNQDELKNQGYIDLGKLKGNMGDQNYSIPDEVDISEMQSVVIYCQPFHVIFSVGSLEDSP